MHNFPTMITPYNADGSVDYKTAEKYVDWYFQHGATGIFAVCQSSEIFFLTVEERVKLNSVVYNRAKELEKKYNKPFTIVSSGHVADTIEEQADELNRIYESGTDALILITNRLAKQDESDDVWIVNAEKLLEKLPENVELGLYECPHPYKRLVTPKVLRWCLSTGRFRYMKDTCCNAAEIARRMEILKGTPFQLLNANCQTLLASLRSGASGFCGIMSNFHPELYTWLCENFEKEPEKAELIQALLGTLGNSEGVLPYPLSAKYHMCLEGIPTENIARNRKSEELTDYMKDCTRQIKTIADHFIEELKRG